MRQNRLPDHLKPGNIFLGQYKILDAVPYQKILIDKLLQQRAAL